MLPVVVIIPARYASVRFPGKPLAKLAGKPMIQWVYENALQIPAVDTVMVATDDQRIFDAVNNFGGRVLMTPGNIRNGSERVGFVAKDIDVEIIVNLQGDEPLISPQAVGKAVRELQTNPQLNVATLGCSIKNETEWRGSSVVKAIVDESLNAIYFSRAPIPHVRDGNFKPLPALYRHIGVYVYRKTFLMEFLKWPEGILEQQEKLEQLRILEKGYKIKVIETRNFSPGVDMPEDVETVENLIKKRGILSEHQ